MVDTSDLSDRESQYVNAVESLEEPSAADVGEKIGVTGSTARDYLSQIDCVEYQQGVGYHLGDIDGNRPAEEIDHSEVVSELSNGGATFDDLTDTLETSKESIKTLFSQMREAGYTIDFNVVDSNGTRHWYIPEEHDKRFKVADGDGHYRFAIISDTHLGSEAEHLDELHDFYDRCVSKGISNVFHAGDISDGWNVHKGHLNVLKGEATGWNRLLEYVTEHYPQRDGITTHFIEGNHDHKYHRRNGIHFGKLIADKRDDLHYCGDSQATFIFNRENDIDLELIHPSGGKPYTTGYRLQTLYRERSLKDRPTIGAVGHLHGSMYAETEGVKGLYAGAWKGTTTYGKRKGHEAKIGGWIIDMDIKDGVITNFVPQWQGYEENGTANSFDVEDIS